MSYEEEDTCGFPHPCLRQKQVELVSFSLVLLPCLRSSRVCRCVGGGRMVMRNTLHRRCSRIIECVLRPEGHEGRADNIYSYIRTRCVDPQLSVRGSK
jgi:hypothetical protein